MQPIFVRTPHKRAGKNTYAPHVSGLKAATGSWDTAGHSASWPWVHAAAHTPLRWTAQTGGDEVLTSKALCFTARLPDRCRFVLQKQMPG